MSEEKPPVRVSLEWQGGEVLAASAGERTLVVDGNGQAGPSPMQLVAWGVASCMAIDVATIVTKGRHPLRALSARLEGRRAGGPPARYTAFDLHFLVSGDVPDAVVERAIALSHEKYCSVWHSMRQDIDLNVRFEIVDRS
jgi:putative redox protein